MKGKETGRDYSISFFTCAQGAGVSRFTCTPALATVLWAVLLVFGIAQGRQSAEKSGEVQDCKVKLVGVYKHEV